MRQRICLFVALLCAAVQGAWAQNTPVTFINRQWDETNHRVVESQKTITDYTLLSGNHYKDWIALGANDGEDHYYVADYAYTSYLVLNIFGKVHLVLQNATLHCKHVKLEQANGAELHVYATAEDPQYPSKLDVYNVNFPNSWNSWFSDEATFYTSAAAIGSGNSAPSGSLYVHSGIVEARQGSCSYGAAIGGGDGGKIGGTINIYGGEVNAHSSDYGAGIGGGEGADQGGAVNIYGGKVYAHADFAVAAGIGGGKEGNGGEVNIWGGTVTAKATLDNDGSTDEKGAAGIGGGYTGNGGNVHIYGGTVIAQNYDVAAPIGCDGFRNLGSLYIADGLKVNLKKSNSEAVLFKAADRVAVCQTRDRDCYYMIATIEPCTAHSLTYSSISATKHRSVCSYCAFTEEADHTHEGTNDCVCGQPYDGSNDTWTVKIFTTADGANYADVQDNKVKKTASYTLPQPATVSGLTFKGYLKSASAPSGIEMLDSEDSEPATLVAAGTEITPTADETYYARYRYDYTAQWTWTGYTSATVTITSTLAGNTQPAQAATISVGTTTAATESANGKKEYNASYTYNKAGGITYIFTDQKIETLYYDTTPSITLSDNSDNRSTLAAYNGRKANVTLQGRTLYKDGSWNTLCLPFDVKDRTASDHPLNGATVKTLRGSEYDSETSTLTLYFDGTGLSTLAAGVPYLVKWDTQGDNVVNPTFNDVLIENAAFAVPTDYVDFVGTLSPVDIAACDTLLFLGSSNTLYHPSATVSLGACRAVFHLHNGLLAGSSSLHAGTRGIVLDFGDGETTGISAAVFTNSTNEPDGWHDLQGRRLNGRPSRAGVYINNGKKVVIK